MQVGPAEILVILIVALLVFGPHRLPEVGRQVGAAVRELRRIQDTVRGELDMVLHPEHGTRTAGAIDEPGDHTAADAGPDTPDEIVTTDVTDPGAAPVAEEDSRFHGPPDSFI
jgi:TatA/E family protein of Tat protein translocase